MTINANSFLGRVLAVFSRRSPGFRPPMEQADAPIQAEQSAVSVRSFDGSPEAHSNSESDIDSTESKAATNAGNSIDDSADFAAFYKQTVSRIHARASLLSTDRDEAYDVVQETYLKLWKNWYQIGGDHKSAETQVYREIMNRLHRHRGNTRWILVGDSKQLPRYIDRHTGYAHPASELSDFEQVRRALEKLPSRQRQVTVMRYLDDLDIHEIADTLMISRTTVHAHLSRARHRLRELLNEKENATILRKAEESLISFHASEDAIQHDYDKALSHILRA